MASLAMPVSAVLVGGSSVLASCRPQNSKAMVGRSGFMRCLRLPPRAPTGTAARLFPFCFGYRRQNGYFCGFQLETGGDNRCFVFKASLAIPGIFTPDFCRSAVGGRQFGAGTVPGRDGQEGAAGGQTAKNAYGDGFRMRVHKKAQLKMRKRVRELTGRRKVNSYTEWRKSIRQYVIGWMNYYKLADMGSFLKRTDEWMRRRIRMVFWKKWK